MKSLSSSLATELARTDGPVIRPLVEITAGDGTVRRLCTDTRDVGGYTWDGELLSLAPLYEAPERLGDLSFEVPDTAANRAVVELAADFRVLIWAEGVAYADADLLFRGDISDPIERVAGRIRADAVARAQRHDQPVGRTISVTEFPGADPDVIGRIKPVIYGAVQDAPCHPVDAGSMSGTVAAMDKTQTSIELSDASRFPSSGTVQIDTEQMDYTGKSGDTLTGLSRGVNGTAVSEHDKGATAAEIQTEYDYLVADHPVKSLSNLKVDGVRQTGSDYSLITDDGSGRAQVRFTTLPTVEKAVHVEVDDQLDVDDDIAVADDIGVSSSTDATRSVSQSTTSTMPRTLSESDTASTTWDYTTVGFDDPGGTIESQTVEVVYAIDIDNDILQAGDKVLLEAYAKDGTSDKQILYEYFYDGSLLWTHEASSVSLQTGDNEITISLNVISDYAMAAQARISKVRRTAHVVGSVSSSKSGGAYKDSGSAYRSGTVSLTGNSVADTKIGGVVTADVEGWADDSSGTITGTAGALIERPDHVVRHLLRTYGGAPDAETPAAAFDDFGADRLAARMESRRQVRELAAGLARQARGLTAYTGGRWIMRRRPDASPTPDLTLTDSDIIRQDDGASTLRISHVGLRELANRIEWRAGRKPDGAWVATGSVEDTTSQSRYGLREMTEDLDAVPEEIQATDRVNWELPRRATPTRRVVEMQTTLAAYAVEVGDVVRVDSEKLAVDVTGEVVRIGPRVLTGRGAGSMSLTVEETA